MRPFVFTLLFTLSASAADMTHFEQRIRPLLIENCIGCHGPEKQKGGLRLDSRAGWQTGGDSGAAIVPGKLDTSHLWKAISYTDRDLKMPPKRKLKESEVADLKKWIEDGAPDPREEIASSGGKTKAARADASFWSFQPPKVSEPAPALLRLKVPAPSSMAPFTVRLPPVTLTVPEPLKPFAVTARVPAPAFVNPPVPTAIAALGESVESLPLVSIVPPLDPVEIVRDVVMPASVRSVPPLIATAPAKAPSALSVETAKGPPLRLTPPEKELAPVGESVSTPAPLFVSAPLPPIVPPASV